jgi:hypothetical protein
MRLNSTIEVGEVNDGRSAYGFCIVDVPAYSIGTHTIRLQTMFFPLKTSDISMEKHRLRTRYIICRCRHHFLPALAFLRLAKSKSSLPALLLFAICFKLSFAVVLDVLLSLLPPPNNDASLAVDLTGANVPVPDPCPSMKEN